MNLPKFIITMDGYFRLGMVNQHKDLLLPGDQCIGELYTRSIACSTEQPVSSITYLTSSLSA